MKGDKSYHEHYYERGEKYTSPFSTNGDRFRTLLILCEELRYDRSLSRHPPLTLSSDDGTFHLRIGSSFARPVAQTRKSDWSAKASGQYTTRITYEHAKWAAQTDCALRSRGLYDYALFSDIDEVAMGGNEGLAPALEMCEQAHTDRGVIGCSFNSNTVSSVFTKLTDEEEMKMKDKLLLERYSNVEAKPFCPSNCKCLGRNCKEMTRKYHYGRQKYMLNMHDLTIPPRPLWTHAIARDYNEMDRIMEQLPDDVFHIRHYQGHWLKNNNLLDTMEEKNAPLPKEFIDLLRETIFENSLHCEEGMQKHKKIPFLVA
ncbi:glycosyltransferase (family 92) [Skeletonema marinoi]|uniref:Glycosyltransferase (Family 92) n=1 Tax=Skeletonema marinoi TaxID=267567 RepID=A0AAD8YGV4_9STRA|nr:glycosyltransferase (family 92) [Skeletonema marinoi]